MDMTSFVLGIIGSLVATFIGVEIIARLPHYTDRVIAHAASRLPRRMQARYREEWSADVLAQPTDVSRFGRAVGCAFAAFVVRHERRKQARTLHREKTEMKRRAYKVGDLALEIGRETNRLRTLFGIRGFAMGYLKFNLLMLRHPIRMTKDTAWMTMKMRDRLLDFIARR